MFTISYKIRLCLPLLVSFPLFTACSAKNNTISEAQDTPSQENTNAENSNNAEDEMKIP